MTEQVPSVKLEQVRTLRPQLKYPDSCYGDSVAAIITST